MSQQKVDAYKSQKKNRAAIAKKEKAKTRVQFVVVIAIIAALLIWFCVAVVKNVQAKSAADAPAVTYEMDFSAADAYMNDLSE
ncbi:MAG: hypothetical protein HUJ73_01290 [Eubacterium sp.]|nr:hypothetical protein [Eubacterium sp.]